MKHYYNLISRGVIYLPFMKTSVIFVLNNDAGKLLYGYSLV